MRSDKTKTGRELRVPDWVPEAARKQIVELWASPLGVTDANQQLLKRLATYTSMRTEVWEKLPSNPKIPAGEIIQWAFTAYTIFHSLRRPYPRTKAKWAEWHQHQAKHQPLTDPGYVSNLCLRLWEEIYACKLETELYWPHFWVGEKTLNPDNVLSILDHLREFYVRMHAEYEELLRLLPRVNRWNTKAHQKFFTEFLSAQMKKTYGRPLDEMVAGLTNVAFDLDQGVGSETIRGRRRLGKAPEKLRRKTR
jgi:hypothetical protein